MPTLLSLFARQAQEVIQKGFLFFTVISSMEAMDPGISLHTDYRSGEQQNKDFMCK